MEALLVAILTALTVGVGALLWQLMVRPEMLMSVLSDGGVTQDVWFEQHAGAVWALRMLLGAMVFLLGFLTGLALTFLSSTG